jgi:hypothetical protein
MYHLEFYKGILEHLGNIQSGTVLSGIYGDVWAGSWSFPDIRDPSDVRKLAVTHGMVGSKSRFYDPLLVSESEEIYFQLKAEKLKEPIFRVLEASRLKAVLNRHLIATPNHFSLAVESPFLEIDIVSGMLNLDPERRNRREWQRDYLDKMLPLTRKKIRNPMIHNVSDLQATLQVPVPEMSITGNSPVELRLLNVDEINKYIKVGRIYYLTMLLFSLPFISKFKPSLKRLNFRQNYANYMTTFPIFIQFGKVTS